MRVNAKVCKYGMVKPMNSFCGERERERERERDVAVCGGEVKKMKNKKIRKERMSGKKKREG